MNVKLSTKALLVTLSGLIIGPLCAVWALAAILLDVVLIPVGWVLTLLLRAMRGLRDHSLRPSMWVMQKWTAWADDVRAELTKQIEASRD